jgi:hypothetical protein
MMPNGITKLTRGTNEDIVRRYILELVVEATSQYNDGYIRERTKKTLIELRDYISKALVEY